MATFIQFVLLVGLVSGPIFGHEHNHYPSSGCGRGSGWGSPSSPSTTAAPITADTRTLSQLHSAALAEGGKLIVYAGGDTANQLNEMKTAFETRFPGMSVEIIVDFSKNHDARIDLQLQTNSLIPDVTHLQTLQDFDRWKKAGVLLNYKPIGWDQVYPEFKDVDGAYTAIAVIAFSNNINKNLAGTNPAGWPTEANDYLRANLTGKVVTTYPNDDDAVLFWFKQVIDKYGWAWLEKFVANKPKFVRGTQAPSDDVWGGKTPAVFTSGGAMKMTNPVQFVLPKNDPFVSWGQRAAIFKATKRPAAAKLYLSWWLDLGTQKNTWAMWSVRKDVPPPAGYKSIFSYKGQSDPVEFQKWMANREEVERFKAQVTQIVGEVQGPSPPGNLGLYPTKMLPGSYP
ncbi:uncharacterized protein LOC110841702 [Folsomia candida]|uniref:Uncharacterized protein n=1 Tax=Folsomia candida TaxID=158441 RepID=A0A226F3J7_FOLCA|nr:uncharacterized protein LOC110841702 [Folsomia candida]OXA63930.1 hypothetical protein Fcan01_00164 [Folsomia candida]